MILIFSKSQQGMDKLPRPWELRWSKTKSRFYFYNTETKTSQWKSPVQTVTKNAVEAVKAPNTTTKKSAIVLLPPAMKSDKTDSAQVGCNVKRPKSRNRKQKEDSRNPAAVKETFLPRVLQITEPRKPGKKFPEKSSKSVVGVEGKITFPVGKTQTKKLNDENSKSESKSSSFQVGKSESKVSFVIGNSKSRKDRVRKSTVAEKLENVSESPALEVDSEKTRRRRSGMEEEEEEMEVEYSPEVQMIFQEIQDVREEMKNMDTEEVTSDVQMIVDNMTYAHQCHSQRLWLVLDTNLFLEDDHLLRDLKDQLTRQFGVGFVFVIPWIVIQEIDRIKDNKRLLSKKLDLGSRARLAVNMINNWLERKDPNIVGQNPRDAANKYQVVDGFTIENNDDKILHCCLQFQEKYSGSQVALLTLDKNLRNKGMVMGLNTFSKETLNKWLRNSTTTKTSTNATHQPTSTNVPIHPKDSWFTPRLDSNLKPFTHTSGSLPRLTASVASPFQFSSSNSREWNSSTYSPKFFPSRCKSFTPGFNESLPVQQGGPSSSPFVSVPLSDFAANEERNAEATFLNQLMDSIEVVMLDGLSALLERSMKDAYKDLWMDILVVKKPWSLINVLKAINKHWIAVFKSFWTYEDQFLVQDLCSTFQNRPDSFSDLSNVIDMCRRLWRSFEPKRWDVASSRDEFESIKKESLIQISKLDESLKRGRVSEMCNSSVLEVPTSFRFSVEMDSSTVLSSTASSEDPVASTPSYSMSIPRDPLEPVVSVEDLQRVYECFDAVLKHLISLRDLIREELSLSSSSLHQSNRPIVLQSFVQLGQYICAIHDQYQRALSEDKNTSDVYFQLLSTLSSFAQQFNVQVSPITCHALRQFFKDDTKRTVVEVGFSQIESIRSSVINLRQLLTSEESFQLSNN